ncbi:long-chain-fatty-acid--CoA ligase FadD15 [Actinocatenispora thailandica]|uniref:Acyl-CoA synthetase n=1 Tax=Actinocatenispora thailandica TaxID=227318 RepID=A0A7R7DUN8_9ACTN|nr:AMP-dependent synthetase/ligase [Actinocatenispora thailandica]BCJ38030.1 long-chain-fatty-acid--CoA ligase FadD15 [Actinocatenispora thailandica]
MRDGYRSPPVPTASGLSSMADPVFRNAAEHPDAVAFVPSVGAAPIRAAEFAALVTAVAKGLIAVGVRTGDRVALLSATCYEWTVCDYALWSIGAVSVPMYDTASVEQVGWILRDSGAGWCLVGGAAEAGVVETAAGTIDGPPPQLLRLDDGALAALAARAPEVDDEVFGQRRKVPPESVATIIYTSGTTGPAKGVTISHDNFLSNLDGFLHRLDPVFAPGGAIVLFLPLAHIFTRTMQCASVLRRVRITHLSRTAELAAGLAAARPTVLPLVPRFMEKLRDAAPNGDARAVLGGRCGAIVVGGAPHDERIGQFYRSAGIAVYEGYGLTEVAGPATINGPDATRLGTVGQPLPAVSVRIAADGEVLVRGDCVFGGYHRNPAATAGALVDGWLHTGDIGALDDDGFLSITGRKKDLVITAGGKNVDVTTLESRLRAHPLISQAVVVGDRRPFVSCLVTLDRVALRERGHPGGPLDRDPLLRAEIQAAVTAANQAVSRAESIRAFRILDGELTVAGGELTASLKIRRETVASRYRAEIDAMYLPDS